MARGEVALLVEHLIVGQFALAVGRRGCAPCEHRGRVEALPSPHQRGAHRTDADAPPPRASSRSGQRLRDAGQRLGAGVSGKAGRSSRSPGGSRRPSSGTARGALGPRRANSTMRRAFALDVAHRHVDLREGDGDGRGERHGATGRVDGGNPMIIRVTTTFADRRVGVELALDAGATTRRPHAPRIPGRLHESGGRDGRDRLATLFATVQSVATTCLGGRTALPEIHSWGEYVFDWAWAVLPTPRPGLLPKLLGAIARFTPVPGAPGCWRAALRRRLCCCGPARVARRHELSSACTCCSSPTPTATWRAPRAGAALQRAVPLAEPAATPYPDLPAFPRRPAARQSARRSSRTPPRR